MKTRKSILGFTLYELLAVITVLGLITAAIIPLGTMSYKNYRKSVFSQDCLLFEQVMIDQINHFSSSGTSTYNHNKESLLVYPLKSKVIFNLPMPYQDYLETETIKSFIDEIIYYSSYKNEFYTYEHVEADISSGFDRKPAYFTLDFQDGTKIKFTILVYAVNSGSRYYGYFTNVVITKKDYSYEIIV